MSWDKLFDILCRAQKGFSAQTLSNEVVGNFDNKNIEIKKNQVLEVLNRCREL